MILKLLLTPKMSPPARVVWIEIYKHMTQQEIVDAVATREGGVD